MTQKPIVIDNIKGYEGIHVRQTEAEIHLRLDTTKWDVVTYPATNDHVDIFPKREVKT